MHIRTNPTLNVVFRPVLLFSEWLGTHFPETLVRIRYFVRFKRLLCLDNPQTLNEKILYLSLRTDTSLWTKCADKYAVREYVHECGLDDILVPLYGVWERADQIDFAKLPEEFVMKTTHGCGDIAIVSDKASADWQTILSDFTKVLSKRYGAVEGAPHYMRIVPRLIAEKLLHNSEEDKRLSTSLIDYKIWCFNGAAHYIWVCTNRTKHRVDVMTYDIDWNAHPDYCIYKGHFAQGVFSPKPKNLDRMIAIAELLAKPFPCVRVDLYNIGGKIYFGELTFTSLGGLIDYFTPEFQLKAGQLIKYPSFVTY